MIAATVADKWLAAIEARHVSFRILAVARVVADHADEDCISQISRIFIELTSRAGTVLDAAKGLKALLDSNWLLTVAASDPTTRTPRSFLLATPERVSAHDDYALTH